MKFGGNLLFVGARAVREIYFEKALSFNFMVQLQYHQNTVSCKGKHYLYFPQPPFSFNTREGGREVGRNFHVVVAFGYDRPKVPEVPIDGWVSLLGCGQ